MVVRNALYINGPSPIKRMVGRANDTAFFPSHPDGRGDGDGDDLGRVVSDDLETSAPSIGAHDASLFSTPSHCEFLTPRELRTIELIQLCAFQKTLQASSRVDDEILSLTTAVQRLLFVVQRKFTNNRPSEPPTPVDLPPASRSPKPSPEAHRQGRKTSTNIVHQKPDNSNLIESSGTFATPTDDGSIKKPGPSPRTNELETPAASSVGLAFTYSSEGELYMANEVESYFSSPWSIPPVPRRSTMTPTSFSTSPPPPPTPACLSDSNHSEKTSKK